MRFSRRSGRSPLAALLGFLLVAPLLVAEHVHVADHDGRTHHVDASHGAHEISASDAMDRIPSAPTELGVRTAVVSGEAPPTGAVMRVAAYESDAVPAGARAPPSSSRPRAPPTLL